MCGTEKVLNAISVETVVDFYKLTSSYIRYLIMLCSRVQNSEVVNISESENRRSTLGSTNCGNIVSIPCVNIETFSNCSADYQGILFVKSNVLGLWKKRYCRISGTKLYLHNTCFMLTPTHHLIRYIEDNNSFLYNQSDSYIINIAEGTRIVLTMRAQTVESWEAWRLHLNLALSLSIKLQPLLLNPVFVLDFDNFYHLTVTEIMLQSFSINELILGREKYRELQRFAMIDHNINVIGGKEKLLLQAFELQCTRILLEILHTLITKTSNDYSFIESSVVNTLESIALSDLISSDILTGYIEDVEYQRIRQHMLCILKALGSLRDMSNTLPILKPIDTIDDDTEQSTQVMPLSMKITYVLSFSATFLFNISLMSYPSPVFVGYNSQCPVNSRDLRYFRNADILSCVITCYNQKLTQIESTYVKFFQQQLLQRYSSAIDACSDVLRVITKDEARKHYRGWGSLITAARSGDNEVFQLILNEFRISNPSKLWINWKELLVNACGCNQNISLIKTIIRHFEIQRTIAPVEVLVLLVSSIDTSIDVLEYFFDYYGKDPYCLDASICGDSGFVHPSSVFYASMRRYYRALPSLLDRQTLLHVASAGNRLDIVSLVYMWQPSQIRAQDVRGFLPLHIACCSTSSVDVLSFLIDNYPEAILIESSSSSEVFWPDIRHRNTLPIHMAASVCYSFGILKLLCRRYEEALGLFSDQYFDIVKKIIINIVTHSNQSFNGVRLDCLKYALTKFRFICESTNRLIDLLITNHSDDYNPFVYDHYVYLPSYEYMPKKTINYQVLRLIYPYDRNIKQVADVDDESYRLINWNARKNALILRNVFKNPTISTESQYRLSMIDGSNRESVVKWYRIPRLFRSIETTDRTSIEDRITTHSLSFYRRHHVIGVSDDPEEWERTRYLWLHIVRIEDVFRHCVRFL